MRYMVALVAAFLLTPLQADPLKAPQDRVILTVSGNVQNVNVGDEAHFDRAMLEALAQHETLTRTPWHDGQVRFQGPLIRTVLEAADSEGEQVRVSALNDYAATIPLSDVYDYDVIFAMSADGETLRIRDQGPLFVIYPFDDAPALLNEVTLSRSVWQVNHITIE
ncbi:molybdopterin-dependent oxidoreductase [Vreelandella sp. EE22]